MEAGTQFIGVKPGINMQERKSNVANNPTDVFTIEEIAAAVTPAPAYGVYTAIISQTGESDTLTQASGAVTAGVSYSVNLLAEVGDPSYDFSNVGGPTYPDDFSFVALYTATPNDYNGATLSYNTGAPVVVTVLENTIGNVFFGIEETGSYLLLSDNLFNDGRTIGFITFNDNGTYFVTDKPALAITQGTQGNTSRVYITTAVDGLYSNDVLYNTPIEIRVYPDPEVQ